MNNRERFRAAMAFEKTDRPCHVEHGFWPETCKKWRSEGLPSEIHDPVLCYLGETPDLFSYFDVTRFGYVMLEKYFIPHFEEEILEETDTYYVTTTGTGTTVKISKTNVCVAQFLDFPVKTRQDYEELNERLQPMIEQRYPENWEELAKRMRGQNDVLVCTHMDGFFGYPREILGVENMLMMFYDDPDLILDIINDRCDFYISVYEKAIRDTQPDFAFIWEDMCFKNGPLLSPAIFREFMLSAYKKLTAFLRSMGIEHVVVDSDGDISALIPLWLEGGVNCLLPFQAKMGMDVVQIGKDYPDLRIIGGIDKHTLERSRADIDVEMDRVIPPMLERGGYIVSLDHWVQPEIPLENFEYYVRRVREITD